MLTDLPEVSGCVHMKTLSFMAPSQVFVLAFVLCRTQYERLRSQNNLPRRYVDVYRLTTSSMLKANITIPEYVDTQTTNTILGSRLNQIKLVYQEPLLHCRSRVKLLHNAA